MQNELYQFSGDVRVDKNETDLDRGRGRQRRRENGVKMASHVHTWAQHAIFTSSLTSRPRSKSV
jgi:hypothetical protein